MDENKGSTGHQGVDLFARGLAGELNQTFGYCGLAIGPGCAILNSTTPDGSELVIKIEVTLPKGVARVDLDRG